MTSRRPRSAASVAVAVAVVGLCAIVLAPAANAAGSEWNIDRIGGPASAPGVVIAVVDTGVDSTHPAFTGRVRRGEDFVDGHGGDPNGHGTHVAGIAAGAASSPGCGSIGVVPDASVLPVRVLDEDGAGTVADVADGIRWAADEGATIINLSLGTDVVLRNVSGSGLQDAIRYAWGKESIPVLAAGNDGLFGGLFGSGYGDLPAVVVTATDHEDGAAPYATSVGSAMWGVAAPGGDGSGLEGRDILSAFPDRRCALQAGTSMAVPHVSGALAALRARGLSPGQAVERLLSTARDLGRANTYGHGLIDLRAALADPSPTTVATVAAAPPAPVTTTEGPPGPAPTTTRARVGTAPEAPEDSTAPPTPESPTAGTEGGAVDARDATAAAPPPTEPPQAPDESAGPVALTDTDADGDADDVPGGLVAVAVAALAASGAGAAGMARTLVGRSAPSRTGR